MRCALACSQPPYPPPHRMHSQTPLGWMDDIIISCLYDRLHCYCPLKDGV